MIEKFHADHAKISGEELRKQREEHKRATKKMQVRSL
jgi:hypothetical protein